MVLNGEELTGNIIPLDKMTEKNEVLVIMG
jgi:hypothetical protein